MRTSLELGIRYVGFGLVCSNCGRVRETTRYVLRNEATEELLQEFRLCDACQDKGFVIRFKPFINQAEDFIRARRVKISQKLERGLAKDVGGKVQPGSGNKDAKSDVRIVGAWRLEHKFTDSVKSYTLLVRDLSAVIRHANLAGEWPALVLTFRALARKFAILPYELFLEFVEKLRGEEKKQAEDHR